MQDLTVDKIGWFGIIFKWLTQWKLKIENCHLVLINKKIYELMIKDSRMQEEKNCMLETQQNVSISIQLYSLWEDLLSAYMVYHLNIFIWLFVVYF